MKVVAGVLCAIVLVAAAGHAQAKKMYAGVKGGVNMAELGGDDAPENGGMRNGFAGGAFYGADFSQFGVRGELNYVQKGGEGDFVMPGDDHAHESVIKLDYVEIPVLFTANFPAGEKLAFSVFAGPTFAFNTTAEVEVVEHGETLELDNVKSFEFGAAVGGGIEYMLSSFSIVADVRYSLGASTVVEDVAGQSVDAKNRGVGVMAGVKFPIGSN